MLGVVEIKSRQNIMLLDSLYLVHPWIDFLLDQCAIRNIVDMAAEEDDSSDLDEFFNAVLDFSTTLDVSLLDSALVLSLNGPLIAVWMKFSA